MARTYDWYLKTEDSGSVWTLYATLPRPNEALSLGINSTIQQVQLANGSFAVIIPETKYNYEPLQLVWYADTSGVIRAQIDAYAKSGTRFKLIDQNNDEYIGYFTSSVPVWLSGKSDTYDITAIFWRESD